MAEETPLPRGRWADRLTKMILEHTEKQVSMGSTEHYITEQSQNQNKEGGETCSNCKGETRIWQSLEARTRLIYCKVMSR